MTMDKKTSAQQPSIAFELAPEQIEVCLRLSRNGKRYQLFHFLRPPGFEDWRDYERNLRGCIESLESDGEEALRFEARTMEAAAALYDGIVRRTEGYRAGEAGSVVPPEKIPLGHKEMVVRGLAAVAPAADLPSDSGLPEAVFSLDSDTVEVLLEASRDGRKHHNLVHVFRPPTAAETIEFSRVVSQALYVRGSKTLKSILPSRLPGLVALYDKLIVQARGYTLAGSPLTDRAAIVKRMDPLHKKVAVQVLLGE